jgi:hypothetical protein
MNRNEDVVIARLSRIISNLYVLNLEKGGWAVTFPGT